MPNKNFENIIQMQKTQLKTQRGSVSKKQAEKGFKIEAINVQKGTNWISGLTNIINSFSTFGTSL